MIRLPRLWLSLVALAYGAYHAVLGFLYRPENADPLLQAAPLVMYLLALVFAVLVGRHREAPLWVALVALATAILVPYLVNYSLDIDQVGTYSTWYMGGISTLMSIIGVRLHRVISLIGIGFTIAQVYAWGGFETLFRAGIIGALLIVLAAHVTSRAITRSEERAARYLAEVSRDIEGEQQTTEARRASGARLQRALQDSLPILQVIASNRGQLSPEQKTEARLLEAQLRDDIRGRSLNSDAVKQAVRGARRRGVEVQLLDDGGLTDVTSERRAEIETAVLDVLHRVQRGRVVVRAAKGSDWNVTVAAIQKELDQPEVFLRL